MGKLKELSEQSSGKEQVVGGWSSGRIAPFLLQSLRRGSCRESQGITEEIAEVNL